jgi:hypothetical protein
VALGFGVRDLIDSDGGGFLSAHAARPKREETAKYIAAGVLALCLCDGPDLHAASWAIEPGRGVGEHDGDLPVGNGFGDDADCIASTA